MSVARGQEEIRGLEKVREKGEPTPAVRDPEGGGEMEELALAIGDLRGARVMREPLPAARDPGRGGENGRDKASCRRSEGGEE